MRQLTLNSFTIQQHHTGNVADLMVTMVEVIYSFGLMFVACEMGQRENLRFEECNDMLDQLDWHLFPAKIQRMLPTIMSFTQQPVKIQCFGSAACDRETFKYVRLCLCFCVFDQRDYNCHVILSIIQFHFHSHTFKVVKTAFSYFTILRQFSDKF